MKKRDAQWRAVLALLDGQPGMTVKELAAACDMSVASVGGCISLAWDGGVVLKSGDGWMLQVPRHQLEHADTLPSLCTDALHQGFARHSERVRSAEASDEFTVRFVPYRSLRKRA